MGDKPKSDKPPMTVSRMAELGGIARGRKLTAEQLTAIGKKGAAKRWAGHWPKNPARWKQ